MSVLPPGVAIISHLYSTAQSRFCISASDVPGKDVQHVAILKGLKASIALFFFPSRSLISGYRYTPVSGMPMSWISHSCDTTGQEYKFGDISKEAAKRAKNAVANLLGQERCWLGRFVFDSKISQNQMAEFIDCTGNLLFGAFELLKSWVSSSDFPTGGVQVWRCDEKGHEQGNGCYRRLHRERGRGTVDHKGHGTADLWVKSVCEYGLDYQRLKVSCFLHRAQLKSIPTFFSHPTLLTSDVSWWENPDLGPLLWAPNWSFVCHDFPIDFWWISDGFQPLASPDAKWWSPGHSPYQPMFHPSGVQVRRHHKDIAEVGHEWSHNWDPGVVSENGEKWDISIRWYMYMLFNMCLWRKWWYLLDISRKWIWHFSRTFPAQESFELLGGWWWQEEVSHYWDSSWPHCGSADVDWFAE